MDWNISLPETAPEEGRVKCNFCGNPLVPAERTVTGPEVRICFECVQLCAAQLGEAPEDAGKPMMKTCSFCGRTSNLVEESIAAPEGVYICRDCLRQATETMERQGGSAV